MKKWPEFDDNGDLPVGIHQATIDEVVRHFGPGSVQRRLVAQRLERIFKWAISTGQVAKFIVFGSFVTAKPDPGDVDIFMLMEDSFDSSQVHGEAVIIFDHQAAQNVLGASVFWIRRFAVIGGVSEALQHWQIKRGNARRGIVEVISDDPERSGT
jgi:hypothetical protein